ncbi:HNH endonuclease [Streptosporangium jomthongense]|uniref:HNH endonuclease n=1 Tax=Streptosporangium jomthongense TaxID=1193683 RepID=A0ABV8FA40_9ACTN
MKRSTLKSSGTTRKTVTKSSSTGPTPAVRHTVRERDRNTCVVCGVIVTGRPASIHHRRNRGMGGSSDPRINDVTNLVIACGDGTSGCHGILTNRPWEIDAEKHGWIIGRNSVADPALVPVLVAWLGWCLPTPDGRWEPTDSPLLPACLQPKDDGGRCGICRVDLALQAADPRYGSPSDLWESP